jgi:hypothetical protein
VSIQYERDDRIKRAVITITGSFDALEAFDCLERHRAGGAWTYGLLYDLRHTTGEPTIETLRAFASTIESRPGEPRRGPVAVLTANPVMYSRACTYAALAKGHATIDVFRDHDEAIAWLNGRV